MHQWRSHGSLTKSAAPTKDTQNSRENSRFSFTSFSSLPRA